VHYGHPYDDRVQHLVVIHVLMHLVISVVYFGYS
jgi:hypothetical protein